MWVAPKDLLKRQIFPINWVNWHHKECN